uniref:Baculoviral IAP repeat-containing protein 5 n=1 Tax=Angiostrongylus cantonensis TaxID=6313 RepID=A0A0K0D1K6_ANGCA
MSNKNIKSRMYNEITSDESNVIFYVHRKETFRIWPFDKKNARCSSDALARAGFVYTGTRREPAVAKCVFCFKELIFEKEDDPWEEHRSHSKNCCFVELNKPNEKDWTVRDFMFLVSGRIAASQRVSILEFAELFRKASEDIEEMYKKGIKSMSRKKK